MIDIKIFKDLQKTREQYVDGLISEEEFLNAMSFEIEQQRQLQADRLLDRLKVLGVMCYNEDGLPLQPDEEVSFPELDHLFE